MYNENLKKDFVRDFTSSANTSKTCETIFKAVEKYECEWGGDISTMDLDTLCQVIENVTGMRSRSKYSYIYILKEYSKWCMDHGVQGANDNIYKINIMGLEKIRQQTVSSPAQLEDYLNKLYEPVKEKTNDIVFRCYYWLAFAGMEEEDIVSVKCADVDFVDMVIRYSGTEFPIYREAVPAVRSCVELTKFAYKHPRYSTVIWKDRIPGDTLIRGTKAKYSLKNIREYISKRAKKKRDAGDVTLNLSHQRTWISGIFYRMYEQEQMGIAPNFKYIAANRRDRRCDIAEGEEAQKRRIRQRNCDYLEDYTRWKLAYRK